MVGMNMAAPVETTGALAEASVLQAQFGHLDGKELLEVMIKDVFKDRIALVLVQSPPYWLKWSPRLTRPRLSFS
jgi:hypothetical protein